MLALFSDVHANLPATEAVAEEISASGAEFRLCLGDLIGYGAQPSEVIARTLEIADQTLAGNHDVDVASARAAPGVTSLAKRTQAWTRERLDRRELQTLAELPRILTLGKRWVAVHGCFLNDLHYTGYVTSTMLDENLRAVVAHEEWPRLAFCGHTHLPMCGWLDRQGGLVEPRPAGVIEWPSSARAVIINPGAVGQPRDGDPRAAWALVDEENCRVEFRRVRYDVARAVAEIAAAGLPAELGERLEAGR